MPEYLGSALRGGFGHAFRRTVCIMPKTVCEECPLRRQCPYVLVFETPAPEGVKLLAPASRAPHPFVITPPGPASRIDSVVPVRVVLLGGAANFFPHFAWAFRKAGETGLGGSRIPFDLESITHVDGKGQKVVLYDGAFDSLKVDLRPQTLPEDGQEQTVGRVELRFLTPLRLRRQRRLVTRLTFEVLVTNILRRLTLLDQCHGDGSWQVNHKELIERSRNVRVVKDSLRWFDWTRYSSRQRTKMQMGGLLGTIQFEGELGPFMPLLRAAELVNVGRNTSFGLGRMNVVGVM